MERSLSARVAAGLRTAASAGARVVARMVATIAGASLFVFVLLEVSIPGGYRATLLTPGDNRSTRARRLIQEYHLDDNVFVRYLRWLGDAMRGDFGRSSLSGDSVSDLITHRLSISMELMLVAVALTLLIGIPLGLLSVAWAERTAGKLLSVFFGVAQSIPIYVTPIFLTAFFAVRLRWLPASGWTRISDSLVGNIENLVLPLTALVLAEVGIVARIVRSDVLRVMGNEYIVAARGKGLSTRYVLTRHALRPASIGLLNLIGLNIGSLLTGALIVETIFGIGGLGQVLLESSLNRDLYVLLGVTSYSVVVYVLFNAIVDALLLLLDPRISSK